jgi:hypothetical protein
MPYNCPKCSAEIPAVSEDAFKTRITELTASKDAAEAAKAQAIANLTAATSTANRLSARIAGYNHDDDVLSVLQDRHAKSGYQGAFSDWLTDANGAATDKIAPLLRAQAQAPVVPPVPAEMPPAPVAPPAPPIAPQVSASATVAAAPATTPRKTAEQIYQENAALKTQYAAAKSADDRARIKAQMDENWKQAG